MLQLFLHLPHGPCQENPAQRQLAGEGVAPLVHPHILRLIQCLQVQVAARDGVLDGLDVVDAGRVLMADEEHEAAQLLCHRHL